MIYVIMAAAMALIAIAFYIIGHEFGVTDGHRKAREEFDVALDEMRQDEKELAEAFAGVKKQISEIEKIGKFDD